MIAAVVVVAVFSVCSEGDLKEVVGRLRDWFRVLHDNGNHKRLKLQKPEKNSESLGMIFRRETTETDADTSSRAFFPAEFEVWTSPICKDPLGWMFSRLDTNFDLQLDQSEIKSLYLDRNEPCSDAFFKSCDVHVDKVLTSTEWCTCFQRYTGTTSKRAPAEGSTLERSSAENLVFIGKISI